MVVVEKTSESSLACKEIKPVNPKENHPEYSLEGLVLKLKLQNWLTGKDPDAGKDGRQKEKGATEDEIVRQHHWLNGYESGRTGR